MKIQVTTVGLFHNMEVAWPEGWPPPPVGHAVSTSVFDQGVHEERELYVRTVVWYPAPEGGEEPFVYVVLGPTVPR